MKKQREQPKKVRAGKFLTPVQKGIMALLCGLFLFSCSSGNSETNAGDTQQESGSAQQAPAADEAVADEGKGVGPVKDANVGEGIDASLVAEGKAIFESKCTPCHQLNDQKLVGPGLAGVTERRKPEWIMNMILNPEVMTKEDPTAKKLFAEHLIQMVIQDVDEQDARAILEFLRQNDNPS